MKNIAYNIVGEMTVCILFSFLVFFVHLSNGTPLQGPPYQVDKSGSRIQGGVEAPKNFAGYSVALIYGDRVTLLMCGGSIVSRYHVLTAAHCIDSLRSGETLFPSLRGVIGSNDWTSTKKNVKFSHYINHPGWDSWDIKNDVGVLYLTEELELNERVTIIPLSFEWVGGDEDCHVTGWGRVGDWSLPDKLQLLYLKTMSPKACLDGVYEASLIWGIPPPVDPKVEICTFHSVGHGMCHGDSGSALVLEETGHQIGIVSWGFACAVGAPDMYTRISGVKEFLILTLKGHI